MNKKKEEKYLSRTAAAKYFRKPMPVSVGGVANFLMARENLIKPIKVGEGRNVRYWYKEADIQELVDKYFRGEIR